MTQRPNLTYFCKQLYRNIAMPTHLHVMYGFFPTTTAELSSYNRDHMAYKA